MANSFIKRHWRKGVGVLGGALLAIALKGKKKEEDGYDYEDEELYEEESKTLDELEELDKPLTEE